MSHNAIVDLAITQAISLERYKQGHIKAIAPILNKLSLDISRIILRMDTSKLADVNRRLRQVDNLIDAAFRKIEAMCLREYKELIKHVITSEEETLALAGEESTFTEKEKEAQGQSLLAALILGKGFRKQMSDLRASTKGNIRSQVKSGITDNESISTIVQRIRGTQSRRFADGILSTTIRHVDGVVRTAIQTYVSRAKMWAWNRAGIKKYIWIAVLDSNTTPICRGRSNKIYIVGSGPLPPAHFRCRSTITIFKKGMQIPQSYSAWLRQQPRNKIEDILGKRKAALFLSGKLPLDKFTVPSGKELTLKQLKSRGIS